MVLPQLVLVLCFVVTSYLVLVACQSGGPHLYPASSKIVGGTEVKISEYPFQVSIQTKTSFQSCGGSIISLQWVLTAAHCLTRSFTTTYQIRVGTTKYASGGFVHTIITALPHPDYNAATYANDIALLQVAPAFVYGPTIGPVTLPLENQPTIVGARMTVIGWGVTSDGSTTASPVLLKTTVPIVSTLVCNVSYNMRVPPNQICAGYFQGGKDSCQGDSGGPLFNRFSIQKGIVSWGDGCALVNKYGVYTEVSKFIKWIKATSGI